ncbi:MAG: DUF4400 domain-containing protein [Gammaproteobacteria bacterium]|nr:DUF4400 domain-containing protein [Rhodocyclaceae bacterium]MBU3910871.1 DUF4400 domain-containing protein [Gammaproteobacteria bacterium]MBU4006325.1 DUF4400 domain-containing protein [Gammaproteobacteria bacterium]MBU4097932.1 DUF4400 domain-containing protein [Gammaproteobacteria bacterium]MBU4148638.1 DUF4400 domain-containing protein [Gammaproteobacteria bacterium]
MARQEQKRGEWGSFIAVLLLIGVLATWALIPVRVIDATWLAEQQQMTRWAGEGANQWVILQTASALNVIAQDAGKVAAELSRRENDHWATDRIYTSLIWLNLITYRSFTLLMWGLLGIPFVLAASVDGFYLREIRKTSFVSQSPIRHKIGIHFFKLVSVAVLVWLCIPVPMPFIVAPTVIFFLALSLWLWVGHLQKRL